MNSVLDYALSLFRLLLVQGKEPSFDECLKEAYAIHYPDSQASATTQRKSPMTNDYDRVAEAIDQALSAFTGNAHEPPESSESNSITMTKDGFITGVIRLQRLRDWVEGLANTHRAT